MLIVSPFHDYYDTASIYGVDKMYVYRRDEKIINYSFGRKSNNWRERTHWPNEEVFFKSKSGKKHEYLVRKLVIGFCGSLYPVIVVEKKVEENIERFSFYSKDRLRTFFSNEKVSMELHGRYRYWESSDFYIESEKGMDDFFAGKFFEPLKAEFQNHKCPVFIYGHFGESRFKLKEQLILNPRLQDYRFAQIKDPVTAFQDIFMFLSGVLGVSHMEMPEFDDKLKAKAKGHDSKYSFRKPPGKRGKIRWR